MTGDNKIKIVFFGTSDFAEVILNKIIQVESKKSRLPAPDAAGYGGQVIVENVVTQPDKPAGRKKVLTPPPVKMLAEKNGIKVMQPEKLDREFTEKIERLKPDLGIVVDYGKIIPKSLLEIPEYGFINIHPSLLPKYRGPAPIETALINGEEKTGVTIIKVDEKMDHGSIIMNHESRIMNHDTYIALSKKLAGEAAELLIKTIPDYVAGRIKPKEQEHGKATYTEKIKKEDGAVDWNKTADEIYNQWRALLEWPGIFKKTRKQENKKTNIKLLRVGVCTDEILATGARVGEFFVENKKLLVKCGGDTYLEIIKLQPEGRKEMDARAFINGYIKNNF